MNKWVILGFIILLSFNIVIADEDDDVWECEVSWSDWTPYYFNTEINEPYCCGDDYVGGTEKSINIPYGGNVPYGNICCNTWDTGANAFTSGAGVGFGYGTKSYTDTEVEYVGGNRAVAKALWGSQAIEFMSSTTSVNVNLASTPNLAWRFPLAHFKDNDGQDFLLAGGVDGIWVIEPYKDGNSNPGTNLANWVLGYLDVEALCGPPAGSEWVVQGLDVVQIPDPMFPSNRLTYVFVDIRNYAFGFYGNYICALDASGLVYYLPEEPYGGWGIGGMNILEDHIALWGDSGRSHRGFAAKKATDEEFDNTYYLYIFEDASTQEILRYDLDITAINPSLVSSHTYNVGLDAATGGGLDVDRAGYVYFADTHNDRILIFDEDLNLADVNTDSNFDTISDMSTGNTVWGNNRIYTINNGRFGSFARRYNMFSCITGSPPTPNDDEDQGDCEAHGHEWMDLVDFVDAPPFIEPLYNASCCGDDTQERNSTFDHYNYASAEPDGWYPFFIAGILDLGNFDYQRNPCRNETTDFNCVDTSYVCCRNSTSIKPCVRNNVCYDMWDTVNLVGSPALCRHGEWYDYDTGRVDYCEANGLDWAYQGDYSSYGEYSTANWDHYLDRINGVDSLWNMTLFYIFPGGITYDEPYAQELALNESRSCCGDDPGEQVFYAPDGAAVCCPAGMFGGADANYQCTGGVPVPVCGDGVITLPETCDCGPDGVCTLSELDGETCVSQGWDDGILDCYPESHASECTFNTSGCFDTGGPGPGPVAGPDEYIVYGLCSDDGDGDEFGSMNWTMYNNAGLIIEDGFTGCVLDIEDAPGFGLISFLILMVILFSFYSWNKKIFK